MTAALAAYLDQEASALQSRLQALQAFAQTMPMVQAAAPQSAALRAIEQHLQAQRVQQQQRINAFRQWLNSAAGRNAPARVLQRHFSLVKLRFNAILDQLDIFADVLTQRGEYQYGTWMAALDYAARDALAKPGDYYPTPPMLCYLERGHGAAIRRARTRLPGGASNPVSIIRVPRERMVGGGIAASLFHEVGHQGAAQLDLVREFGMVLAQQRGTAWVYWQRWCSEILADFWALAQLGVCATNGLILVVLLPQAFVFRMQLDAPHPFPWMRVQISCYLGERLFPDPQWQQIRQRWEAMYPLNSRNPLERQQIQRLLASLPAFADVLLTFCPTRLQGKRLVELFPLAARQPHRLRRRFRQWQNQPHLLYQRPAGEVFAVLGQAREDGLLGAANEAELLKRLFAHWALQNAGIGTPTNAVDEC